MQSGLVPFKHLEGQKEVLYRYRQDGCWARGGSQGEFSWVLIKSMSSRTKLSRVVLEQRSVSLSVVLMSGINYKILKISHSHSLPL